MLDAREEHCVDKDGGVFGGSSPNGYAEVAANAVAVLGQTERLPFHVYSVTYGAGRWRVAACGLFDDTSALEYLGVPISLNLAASACGKPGPRLGKISIDPAAAS